MQCFYALVATAACMRLFLYALSEILEVGIPSLKATMIVTEF